MTIPPLSGKPARVLAAALLLPLLLLTSGCAGYRLGNIPSAEMKGVKTIYVPVVQNNTYEPGAQVMATNAILRALDNDGTYASSRIQDADATLDVILSDFQRKSIRRSRDNFRVTEEYRITLTAKATLTNHRTGQKVFSEATVTGQTDYFVQSDLQEGERQALPLAADDLAVKLVNRITEGW